MGLPSRMSYLAVLPHTSFFSHSLPYHPDLLRVTLLWHFRVTLPPQALGLPQGDSYPVSSGGQCPSQLSSSCLVYTQVHILLAPINLEPSDAWSVFCLMSEASVSGLSRTWDLKRCLSVRMEQQVKGQQHWKTCEVPHQGDMLEKTPGRSYAAIKVMKFIPH